MSRMFRWLTPVITLSLVVAFTHFSRGDEKAPPSKDTGSISGTVTGADGKPAANVHVGVRKPGKMDTAADNTQKQADEPAPTKPDKKGRKPVGEATTDDNGKFKIDNIPAGEYQVIAGMKGQGIGHERVTVKAGETAELNITLKMVAGGKKGKNVPAADNTK